jgi:16S rRNA (guanine527-N7)-methyltransferase
VPLPDTDSIAELARRFELPDGAAGRLSTLLDLLTEDEHAPTAVRDRAAVVDDHLADSLIGLDHPAVRSAESIADIGSGAGLPGLPLAIARPQARVALVESNGRKCAFIEAAARACDLGNTEVVNARAETWTDGLGRFDVVTARALARLDIVAEYAAPLLRIGGSLVAWRGRRDPADEAAAAVAAAKLGLEQREPIAVTPYPGARYRHLHVLTKIAETPPAFPRRPGVARKRPLGGPFPRSDRPQG